LKPLCQAVGALDVPAPVGLDGCLAALTRDFAMHTAGRELSASLPPAAKDAAGGSDR